jgi:uncharacterized protein (TIGR01777 family)
MRYVETASAVINLTGEIIAGKRWSEQQKARILDSRVESTRALVEAIRVSESKPSVLINISGVGYYGNVSSGDVSEISPAGNDFLSHVCLRWELEAARAQSFGVRVVTPRLGVVLARDGGALPRISLPFTFFVGGYLGSGNQAFPWIHRDDLIACLIFLLRDSSLSGPVNVVSPSMVTMKEFCAALGRAMRRPLWTFVPALALKLILGEMADMLLTGQRAAPLRLQQAGFSFRFPVLDHALNDLFGKKQKK